MLLASGHAVRCVPSVQGLEVGVSVGGGVVSGGLPGSWLE